MQIKAVFPVKRSRPVDGIPLEELKKAAGRAKWVRWFNDSDLLSEVSSREFLRRLNAMPEGCEVVIMAKTSRSKRPFPVDTSLEDKQDESLLLNTSFQY